VRTKRVYTIYVNFYIPVKLCVVTCLHISRQHPKYAHTVVKVLEEVFSLWSAPCLVLGNGPVDTHSDNRRGGFFVVRALLSAG
jgi:hypothetical protein